MSTAGVPSLTFEDGQQKVADLEKHLTASVFKQLQDVEQFKRFAVNEDTDTVVWENGADMSPDFLYEIGSSEAARTVG